MEPATAAHERRQLVMQIIKRKSWMYYVSGDAIRGQRLAAGLTQRALADLVEAGTGIVLSQMRISRIETASETALEPVVALSIKKILS